MKIVVGRTYVDQDGDKQKIVEDDGSLYFPYKSETGYWFDAHQLTELPTEGVKADTGKLSWALVPFDAVRGIVEVLRFGATKYAPRNWELGMDWSRCFDACLRHLTAWWQGEAKDPETGFSHLWHAGCCILFLIAYEIRGVGKDDRPTPNSD